MMAFKLGIRIKDRYRRGLAQGGRSNRSSALEASASFNEPDSHYQATSPSSPSVLFSTSIHPSKIAAAAARGRRRGEPSEQWNEVGESSPLESAQDCTESDSAVTNSASTAAASIVAQTYAIATAGSGQGRHIGQEFDSEANCDDGDGHGSLSGGYVSPSFASSACSSPSLSPDSSSHSSDSDDSDDNDDDYEDVDDGHHGAGNEGFGSDDKDAGDSQDNNSPCFSHKQRRKSRQLQQQFFDYYGGRLRSEKNAGLLPPAPAPAIKPISNREALEQEARQRRLERHIDKRRQSLNGIQPPPAPKRKRRKRAKDLRKQVLVKNAQQQLD